MQSARRHAEHGKAAGGAPQSVSDINVTPLVDVCLVLLIIFMVVTPMLQTGVPVQLPETNNPEKYPEGAKQQKVTIIEDGKIFLAKDDWVPNTQDLTRRIAEMVRETPDKEFVVKADKRLRYRQVREVMKAINEAGVTKVGLITTKKGGGS
ncbi:MAG TPA: ExbD/TolR family protein [Thermoanaerobaculaceae bacterium]|nr:ExbD/TolR family protein [Thermoanaerobaculaceae bacterium]HRS15798.1 ExbD/TolR family protein [Thermoanaerobaculaceae bacterium]